MESMCAAVGIIVVPDATVTDSSGPASTSSVINSSTGSTPSPSSVAVTGSSSGPASTSSVINSNIGSTPSPASVTVTGSSTASSAAATTNTRTSLTLSSAVSSSQAPRISPSSTETSSPKQHHKSQAGIIGGIAGGLAVILALSVGLLFYIRQRRRMAALTSATPNILYKQPDVEFIPAHLTPAPLPPSFSPEPVLGISSNATSHDAPRKSTNAITATLTSRGVAEVTRGQEERLAEQPPDTHGFHAAGHGIGENAPEQSPTISAQGDQGLRTQMTQMQEQISRMELLLLQQREGRGDNRVEGSRESDLITLSPPPEYASS